MIKAEIGMIFQKENKIYTVLDTLQNVFIAEEKSTGNILIKKNEFISGSYLIFLPAKKKSSLPTLDEILKYHKEKNFNFNAHDFFNFYEAKGWMVGKNKMKNWKAAMSGWESRTPKKTLETKYKEIPVRKYGKH